MTDYMKLHKINKENPTVLERLGKWFLKESGKKFVFGSAVAASIGIGAIHIIPQTFLLDQLKDIVHLYKNGFTVPVSPQIKERFNRTLNLLAIPEKEQKQFKPFMVFGFDIFSAGTFFSKYGIVVGIPKNFSFIDDDEIEKSDIKINDAYIPWETDEGKLLLESLSLSEKAQMYAIAREVEFRKTPKYFIDGFAGVFSFIAAYSIGTNLNTKLNLLSHNRGVRLTMYGLLGSFFCVNYFFIKDFSQLHYEHKVDEYLKSKDPIFKEGGKEFYDKIVKRNIALRKFMGKVGEKKYTLLGNENYLIRQRHLPLIQRKEFFEVA